jgi:uncharacterized protein (DUF3820 family)
MSTIAINPRLDFGKEKGKTLPEVESSYLKWCIAEHEKDPNKDGPLQRWAPLMKAELERRAKGEKLPSGLEFTDDPLDLDPTKEPEAPPPPKKVTRVRTTAIDGAMNSRELIKQFVLRTDQSVKYSQWLMDLANEARKYGKLEGNKISYDKHTYFYKEEDNTLQLVGVKQEAT